MAGQRGTPFCETDFRPRRRARSRSRAIRPGVVCAAVLAFALAAPGPLAAAEVYPPHARVAPDALRDVRGGMTIGGIDFDFGAITTVLLDGTEIATTTFNVASDGSLGRDLQIHDAGRAVAFDGTNVPEGMDIGSLAGMRGVVVDDGGGASLALSDVSSGNVSSALLNRAPGRDIRQHLDVRITLNNFEQLQGELTAVRDIGRLTSGLQEALAR